MKNVALFVLNSKISFNILVQFFSNGTITFISIFNTINTYLYFLFLTCRFFTSLFGRYHWFVKSMLLIFIISSTGAFRLFFIFQALQETEMGSVHSIMQGAPVLVMILGHFFLNDRLNIVRGFCSLFLIGGIALISQPDGNTEDEVS